MFRTALVASAMLTCALAASATAEDYYDRDNGFRVTIPDGWVKDATPEGLDLAVKSPRFETTRGACAMLTDPFPATRGMTQDQINQELEGAINEAFWKAGLGQVGATGLTLDESGSELRKGKRIFNASFRFTAKKADGTDITARMKATFQAAPDQIGFAICLTDIASEDVEAADIATVLNSFEGMGAQIVASVRPATLLLYAGPEFNGARREITQDMPNLFQAGWSVPTASLGLGGFGLWQVCDGMNFTGNCRIVSTAMSVSTGDRPLRIGSVRRFIGPNTARNILGLATDALAKGAAYNLGKLTAPRGRR
jgi:hypothetical protein